jgi:hypothetical protein
MIGNLHRKFYHNSGCQELPNFIEPAVHYNLQSGTQFDLTECSPIFIKILS